MNRDRRIIMIKPGKLLLACIQFLVILLLSLVTFLAASVITRERPAQALPEYTTRSGEPCVTCHVNPGGGGPRTLRGMLWSARGRPDDVPHLPEVLLAPGVKDGADLYDIACAGCHGFDGEGLFAMGLVEQGISKAALHSFIINGIPLLGMPGFEGQFDDEQLDALVDYLEGLGSGEIEPRPRAYPLPPASLVCDLLLVENCGVR
jgi:mono/diheme cytochrome c family protein